MQRSPEAQRIREDYECVLVSQPWKMSVASFVIVHTSPKSLISCCFFGLTWRLKRWSMPLICDGLGARDSCEMFLCSLESDKAWAVATNASRERG